MGLLQSCGSLKKNGDIQSTCKPAWMKVLEYSNTGSDKGLREATVWWPLPVFLEFYSQEKSNKKSDCQDRGEGEANHD